MLEMQKVDNNNIHKALSLRPLYVTVMCYVEECPFGGRAILSLGSKFSGK